MQWLQRLPKLNIMAQIIIRNHMKHNIVLQAVVSYKSDDPLPHSNKTGTDQPVHLNSAYSLCCLILGSLVYNKIC